MTDERRLLEIRYTVKERTLMRYGMQPHEVGEIIERDYQDARVLKVTVGPLEDFDRHMWGEIIRPGDWVQTIEYEPLRVGGFQDRCSHSRLPSACITDVR